MLHNFFMTIKSVFLKIYVVPVRKYDIQGNIRNILEYNNDVKYSNF